MKSTLVIFLLTALLAETAYGQQCVRPTQPDVTGEKFRALQKRAAYAAFLSDACGFENDVQRRFSTLVKLAYEDSTESQQRALDEFRARKKVFADDASMPGKIKRCTFETAKTRSLTNDVAEDISIYADSINQLRKTYLDKKEEWNSCVERQRAAELLAKQIADAEAYRNSEDYARKKSVEDIQVGFRASFSESGTYVLVLRNPSNQTADFQLICYTNSGASKAFPIALTPGASTEIGFLEGWTGNFVAGEYCRAAYKGEFLWRVTK